MCLIISILYLHYNSTLITVSEQSKRSELKKKGSELKDNSIRKRKGFRTF